MLHGLENFVGCHDERRTARPSMDAPSPGPKAHLESPSRLPRVVLAASTKPLWEFDDTKHFVMALIAAIKCIAALQHHGALHGTISIENVLLYAEKCDGRESLLLDLDSAKPGVGLATKPKTDERITSDPQEWKPSQPSLQVKHTQRIMELIHRSSTVHFMAVERLRHNDTKLAEPRIKHDLESLIWTANFALYRRAFERARGLPPDNWNRLCAAQALEDEYDQENIREILTTRKATLFSSNEAYENSLWSPLKPVFEMIEGPLEDLRKGLLMMAYAQIIAPIEKRGAVPSAFSAMMEGIEIRDDMYGLRASLEMTCSWLESRLLAFLKSYKI